MEDKKKSSLQYPNEDKYDVFFTYSVPSIDEKYLDKDGKIALSGDKRFKNDGNRNFKCFSLNVAEKQTNGNDAMYTKVYGQPVGYEFDFDDDEFVIKSGFWGDGQTDMLETCKWLENEINNQNKKNNDALYYRFTKQFDTKKLGKYWKHIKEFVDGYIFNEKMNKDLRKTMKFKLLNRIESIRKMIEEAKNKNITDKSDLTKMMYNNSNLNDESFDEKRYGTIKHHQSGAYSLDSMNLNINLDTEQVSSGIYNEMNAFGQKAKPKRPFIVLGSKQLTPAIIKELLEVNKKYFDDAQIRIIDIKKKMTYIKNADEVIKMFGINNNVNNNTTHNLSSTSLTKGSAGNI